MLNKSVLSASFDSEISNRLLNSFTINAWIKDCFKLKAVAKKNKHKANFLLRAFKNCAFRLVFCDCFQFEPTFNPCIYCKTIWESVGYFRVVRRA